MSKKQLSTRGKWELILHDDNNISFEHVINCLIEICGHNEFQANQCALITDRNKKCSVVVDKYTMCVGLKNKLIAAGLTVTMNKYKKHV